MKRLLAILTVVLSIAASAHAVISVGAGGSGVLTFGALPALADGWSTVLIAGAHGDISDPTALATAVQTNAASFIATALGSTATVSPSISSSSLGRWNSVNLNIQSVPTGDAYVIIMATLQNDSGAAVSSLTVSYDLGELNASGTTVTEEVPGYHVFFSMTGLPGSWTEATGLSSSTPGTISASLSLGSWAPGTQMYIVWVDDNAVADRNNSGAEEGGYTIDNVSFTPGNANFPLAVTLTSPSTNLSYLTTSAANPARQPVTATSSGTTPATSVSFYTNDVLFFTATTPPYSNQLVNLPIGSYRIYAKAVNATETAYSATNTVVVRYEFVNYNGGTITEDFDSMGATGTETPIGWYVGYNPPINIVTVTVGDGSVGPSGSVAGWNYGTAGDFDRALGTAATITAPAPAGDRSIVVRILNNTSSNIVSFDFHYDGELWRNYTNFQFGLTNEVSYDQGATWSLTGFDFIQPIPAVPGSAGPLNGNDPANHAYGLGGTVTPPAPIVPGGTVYIRWYDNNEAGTDGGMAVDDFSFSASFEQFQPFAILTAPVNGAPFAFGASITVSATASMANAITNVAFFHDGVLIGNDTTSPYSVVYSNATVGNHTLVATARDTAGNSISTTNNVTVTVNPNVPPFVAITNTYAFGSTGTVFLVGTCVTNQLLTSDSDGSITNLDWYENGVLRVRIPAGTNNLGTVLVNDALAGTTVLTAVAWDNFGASYTSAPVSLTITNPAAGTTVIVSNGSVWKYSSTGAAPANDGTGKAWFQAGYDDSLWASGPGYLGWGSGWFENAPANYTLYPERTVIPDIGPLSSRYHAVYFRHAFSVANPSAYTNILLRMIRDDGAVVWLNGQPVWTNNIAVTNDLTVAGADATFYANLATGAGDNGTLVQELSIPTAALIAGANELAVEVHQSSATSHDIEFDLMVWGEASGGGSGPRVTLTQPDAQHITLTWDGSTGYTLQSTTDIANPGSWAPVSGASPVTLQTTGPLKFFRLVHP